ncbi:TPA: acyltransferase family protein [Candidatus Galligastranaerophilus faecipullorum]|nr:acyltransferase family protein [Candidatus Galligastranaerophilus faecipullorum]
MEKEFSNKVNVLKALAILLVVSGHLEFSLLGMFTPYSFQLALFFFISGYLFKDKYLDDVLTFIKRRVRSLLVPYFLYNVFYLGVTVLIARLTGKFWGMPLSLKNFFITPFLNGHQFDLSCPMWFVTQLFMTMIVFLFLFRVLKKSFDNKFFHLGFFALLGIAAIPVSKVITLDSVTLIIIRTMFSLFFVYLGYYYRNYIEDKVNIFTLKWAGAVIALQSVLWLFNRDFDPEHGIGLSYVLVWARFDEQMIVPVITALTGIWASLLVVKLVYPYVKDSKFIKYTGETTYHIMANHLLVMYIITAVFLHIHNIPIQERANHDIYWIYNPIQTTYFYFVLTMVISTYSGVALQWCKKKFFAKL